MGRYTVDVLPTTGAVGLPATDDFPSTKNFWGIDNNANVLRHDQDLALTYAGNPNGLVAAGYIGRKLVDTLNRKLWASTSIGSTLTAVWKPLSIVETVDVRDYGAVPDAKGVYDIVCTNGSATVTSATANWPTDIVGKHIKIYDIANAVYIFRGTVSTRNSATSITLSGTCAASVSAGNGYAYYGSDNQAAIQAALDAAAAMVQSNMNGPNFPHGTGQVRVIFPIDQRGPGYLFNKTLRPGRNVVIDADAMLFNNIGNGSADRQWAFKGTGWHIKKLVIAHNGGMGISMGELNVNASTVIEDLQQWTVGVNYNANFVVESAVVANGGGSGYAVNDTITLTGGTGTQAVLKVTAVNAGAVTAVEPQSFGSYSVQPSNPVSQGSTSGSGTGCTFTLTWSPNAHAALQINGYDYLIVKNWCKGGNIGFHGNQVSDVFCAMPMELIGCSVAVQSTSVENATINWVCDTGSFLAGAIDGSRNSRYYGRAMSVVATTLTYGIQIGEYDAGNKCRGMLVDYIAQRTGGKGAKISNTEDCRVDLLLTNAALFSNSGGSMTEGVVYGSGNNECLLVNMIRDGAISSVYSGTIAGTLMDFCDGAMTAYGNQAAGQKKIVLASVTNDTTFVVPASHFIDCIVIHGNNGNAITGGIKIGTSSGATDVVNGFAVAGNARLVITDAALLKRYFGASDQTCYLQDVTSWNSANITVTVILGRAGV